MAGIKSAHDALSKAMAGDLVGAAKSAATAFKALWAVVMSNPVVAVFAAAAAAIAEAALVVKGYKERMEEAAAATAEVGIEAEELYNRIDKIAGKDVESNVKRKAEALVEKGDRRNILINKESAERFAESDKAAAIAAAAELERLGSKATDGDKEYAKRRADAYERAQAQVKIWEKALANLEKANADAAAAAQKAGEEAAEAQRKAAEETQKAADARRQAEWEMSQSIIEMNKKAERELLDNTADMREKQLAEARKSAEGQIQAAEAAAAAQRKIADAAATKAAELKRRAVDPEYRAEAEAAEKRAEKEEKAYQRAISKWKRGIRGRHLNAAVAAYKAEQEAIEEAKRAEAMDARAAELRESAERHLAKMEEDITALREAMA
ncbi:MAG: hypothetical protein GX608_04020 [Lentisphaerae bacterium]|nr:hypothetical protein [Lentisphaerota bacterium]